MKAHEAVERDLRAWRPDLPPRWRIVFDPRALPDLQGGLVLHVGADGPGGEHAGARVHAGRERLTAAVDVPGLAAALVGELAAKFGSAVEHLR